MRGAAIVGTVLVVLHLAVNIIHGLSHSHLHIGLVRWQIMFVALVIILGPVVAAILLWTPARRIGAWFLLFSMGGSLFFGGFYHFVAHGTDNVAEVPPGFWGTQFKVSAMLLAVVEVLGCCAAIWTLATPNRNPGNKLS